MKIDINLLDLSGKVAIVTGGGDGIGKGCAEILAAAGASVVVSNRHLDKAERTVEEIKRTDSFISGIDGQSYTLAVFVKDLKGNEAQAFSAISHISSTVYNAIISTK